MNKVMEAPASLKCGIEIEFREDGEWVSRECGEPASWTLRVSIGGGPLSEPVFRCEEHLGGTIDFHIGEPTTQSVLVAKVKR